MAGSQIGGPQVLGLLGFFHRMDGAAHLGKTGQTALVRVEQRQRQMDGRSAQALCHREMAVENHIHLMGAAEAKDLLGQSAVIRVRQVFFPQQKGLWLFFQEPIHLFQKRPAGEMPVGDDDIVGKQLGIKHKYNHS